MALRTTERYVRYARGRKGRVFNREERKGGLPRGRHSHNSAAPATVRRLFCALCPHGMGRVRTGKPSR